MAKQRHPHAALIDQLDAKRVREAYGLNRSNLYTWRVRGIPQRYRVSFARLAAVNAVAVPSDFFEGMEL